MKSNVHQDGRRCVEDKTGLGSVKLPSDKARRRKKATFRSNLIGKYDGHRSKLDEKIRMGWKYGPNLDAIPEPEHE